MNLKNRDFLKLLDYTPEEIEYLVDLSLKFKDMKKKGILHDVFRGKNVALIFEKTSTRTRCSFEVAAHDLGMGTTYLDPIRYFNHGIMREHIRTHPLCHSSRFFVR